MSSKDSFHARRTLHVGDRTYAFYSLERLEAAGFAVQRLPYSLKILLENLLRREDGESVDADDVTGPVQAQVDVGDGGAADGDGHGQRGACRQVAK